jgi:hypothetical protein
MCTSNWGVQALEVVDQRRDIALAKGGGRGELQQTLRAGLKFAYGLLGVAQSVEEMTAVLYIKRPCIGKPDLPRGAVEQLHA